MFRDVDFLALSNHFHLLSLPIYDFWCFVQEREEKERKEAVKEKKEKAAKDKANAAAAAAASEVTAAKATDATASKSKPPSKEEGKQSNGTNNNKDSKVGTDSKSGTVTINGKTLTNHGKGRNPMVKMPSKDSGYSVQSNVSSHSGGSKDKDDPDSISLDSHSNPRKADSGTGSMSHGLNTDSSDKTMSIPQKPFIKQDSLANVSASFHWQGNNLLKLTNPKISSSVLIKH